MGFLAFEDDGECYLVVDASAIERHSLFFANLLSGCLVHDAQGQRVDPLTIWQAVRYGQWASLLNGYYCQNPTAALKLAMRPGVVAVKRSLERQSNICTLFSERDGHLSVEKRPLDCAADPAGATQPIFPGMACELYLCQLAAQGDWARWRQALEQFVATVFSRFALDNERLQGLAIDAIARNAVIDEHGQLAFFDLEFAEYGPLPKSFFIYRLCLSLMGRRAHHLAGSGFSCLYEVYCHLCQHFDLAPDNLCRDVRLEVAFQARISDAQAKRPRYYRVLKPFARQSGLLKHWRNLRYRLCIAWQSVRHRDSTQGRPVLEAVIVLQEAMQGTEYQLVKGFAQMSLQVV